MRVLILGGTRFVGRHIAEGLLAAGHEVTVFNRGRSPDPLPATVQRLRGDRDQGAPGLHALAGRTWDACIDVNGYTPRQVRPAAERLRDRVRRYVYLSAVSVYGDPQDRPVRESQPRLAAAGEDVTDVDGETYGALKVACEDIVQATFGARCTVLRPQVVVGPHDPTDRYLHWTQRALRGGEMLAPGDGRDHLQVIDVRDVARFACTAIERDLSGAFNLAGPRIAWAEFMQLLGAPRPVWVEADILEAAGLTFVELGVYRREFGRRGSLMHVSAERARSAGLTLTDPAATLADVRAWACTLDRRPTLPPEREAELIALARRRATQTTR